MYFGESVNQIDPILFFENYTNFIIDNNENISLQETNEDIIDAKYHGPLKPVFILLTYCDTTFDRVAEKFVKNQTYWHATIGFDHKLTNCFSFNYNPKTKETGLMRENIETYKERYPNANCEISCFLINEGKFNKLRESLNYYILNKNNTKYDFLGLFFSQIGKHTKDRLKTKQVCSTFVYSLLKSIDIDFANKATNLIKPDDLIAKDRDKQFVVYKGKIKDVDQNSIYRKLYKLKSNIENDYFYI